MAWVTTKDGRHVDTAWFDNKYSYTSYGVRNNYAKKDDIEEYMNDTEAYEYEKEEKEYREKERQITENKRQARLKQNQERIAKLEGRIQELRQKLMSAHNYDERKTYGQQLRELEKELKNRKA